MAAVTILAEEGVLLVVAMVEMMVGRPMMKVVVAKGHGGERERINVQKPEENWFFG